MGTHYEGSIRESPDAHVFLQCDSEHELFDKRFKRWLKLQEIGLVKIRLTYEIQNILTDQYSFTFHFSRLTETLTAYTQFHTLIFR